MERPSDRPSACTCYDLLKTERTDKHTRCGDRRLAAALETQALRLSHQGQWPGAGYPTGPIIAQRQMPRPKRSRYAMPAATPEQRSTCEADGKFKNGMLSVPQQCGPKRSG